MTPDERQEARRIIIPRRAGEQETAETTRLRDQAVTVVRTLQQSSRAIRFPQDVRAEIESRQRVVEAMRRTGVPYLQDRYDNELDEISSVLAAAKRASDAGRSTEALPLLERATAMMVQLAAIYPDQIAFMINGVPPNLRGGTQTFNDTMDSIEATVLDVGTPNAARAEIGRRAFNLLARNLHLLNMGDVAIRAERDALVEFTLDNGVRSGTTRQARDAHRYTPEMAARDNARLQRIEANINRIAAQLREEKVAQVTRWRDEIAARTTQLSAQDTSRGLMDSLRQDLDALLVRLGNERTAREVRDEDISLLESRYLAFTGRPQVATRAARDDQLLASAAELRGSGTRSDRNVEREGTQEWFGAQAAAAMTGGNREIAALAVAMGFLERTAAGMTGGARAILGDDRYNAIIALINRRASISPVQASQFATDIEVASLSAEASRLERSYRVHGRGTARERLEMINEAVRVARERRDSGDLEGARRILDMVSQYASYMDAARGRTWAASDEMEAAVRVEIRGGNGRQGFEDAMTRNQFAAQISDFRSTLTQWGRGIADQKRVVEGSLTRVEELISQGNFREAQGALLRIIMYADCVEKLGVRRNGRIESMNPRFDGSGMERALGAFARRQAQVDGRGIETVFNEGYVIAQRNAVDLEATRLADVATRGRYTVGRETVDLALTTARARAQQGDYEGAFRMLRFVQEYFGSPVPAQAASGSVPARIARAEGWRYRLASRNGAGFVDGRNRMLDAIRMEAESTSTERTRAAAQLFQQGTARIAECDMLMASSYRLRQRYDGAIPFVDGNAQTRGRLIVGYDAQNNPMYLDLARIRGYEAAHADDQGLGTGPTIAALFRQLDAAANNGDISQYNRVVERLFGRVDPRTQATVGGRFWLVAQRAARQQAADQMIEQLGTLPAFIGTLPAYDGSPARRRAIETERTALIARIEAARYTNEEFAPAQGRTMILTEGAQQPRSIMDAYGNLLSSVDRERRISLASSVLTEQISLSDQFNSAVGYPGGEITTTTRHHLAESRRFLVEARTLAIAGQFDESAAAYERAINHRIDALQTYWARAVITTGDVLFAHRARVASSGPDERMFPLLRLQRDELEISPYRESHRMAFRDILYGNTSGETARQHGERMQRRMQGTVMIESSIFGIPAGSTAQQVLSNFTQGQRDVRSAVYAAWRFEDQALQSRNPNERQMLMARAQREFETGQSAIQEMQRQAERARMVAQVAVLAVGVAALFIPYVGIYVSGAIFLGAQVESMVTEHRMNGTISTESWVMFGVTLATLGFAAAGGVLRTFAAGARVGAESMVVAGNLTRAEQLIATYGRLRVAGQAMTGVAFAGGMGISGYMEYSAYRLYQEAQRTTDPVRREMLLHQAMLTAGMGIFPLVHMGVAYGYRGMTAPPRMRTTAALEEMVPGRVAETAELSSRPLAERVRTPEGLFEFMTRLRSTDEGVRSAAQAELATITNASLRAGIARLADSARVGNTTYMNLLQSLRQGELTPNARADLESSIGRLSAEAPPEGPTRGPSGGGPRTTRPEIDGAGLSEPQGLFGFLQDLLVPNGAPEPALNARASARATLARLRADPRTAPIADLVDNIIGNPGRGITGSPTLSAAINGERATNPSAEAPGFGSMDPFTTRGLGNVARNIGRHVRQPVREAAIMEGTTGQPIQDAVGTQVQGQPAQAEGVGGRIPVRAMADQGGQGSGGGQPPAPGQMQPAQGGPQTGGPRGTAGGAGGQRQGARPPLRAVRQGEEPSRAQGDAQAQPQAGGGTNVTVNVQAPVPQPGRVTRAGRFVGGLLGRGYQGVRRWARGESQMENIPVFEGEVDAMIGQRINQMPPEAVVRMMRMVYERMMSPETRGTVRTECMGILEQLFRRPDVQRLLSTDPTLRADPAVRSMVSDITRGIDTGVASEGTQGTTADSRRTNYLATLPEMSSAQRGILVDMLERQGMAQGLPSLGVTCEVLGLELNASQRANMLLRMIDTGLAQPSAIRSEMASARTNAEVTLTTTPTEGNAVFQAVREGVLGRVRNNQGGNPDAVLLEVLRSPQVADAVGRQYGADARTRYQAAVGGDGTLQVVLDRLPRAIGERAAEGAIEVPQSARRAMSQGMTDLGVFVRRLSSTPEIADGLSTMGVLSERFSQMQGTATAHTASAATAGRSFGVGPAVGRGARRVAPVLRALDPSYSLRTGIGDFAAETRAGGWRAGVRNSLLSRRTAVRLAHAAGWGVGLYYGVPALVGYFRGSRDIRRGNQIASDIYGTTLTDENARWLASDNGERFGRSLVVADPHLKPRSADDMRAVLMSEQLGNIWINSARLNDAISDGRAMMGALSDINSSLATALGPAGEDRNRARTDFTARLGRLGITTEDVRSALIREKERSLNRQLNPDELARVQQMDAADMAAEFLTLRGSGTQLNMSDMTALRLGDWLRRGVAMDSRHAAVQTYLEDLGMSGTQLTEASQFYSRRENADAFYFVWNSVGMRNIPAAYADVIMRDLMASATPGGPTNFEVMRQQSARSVRDVANELRTFYANAPAENTTRVNALEQTATTGTAEERARATAELSSMHLAEQIRRRTITQGYYLEIPRADGSLGGIQRSSFLDALDERAWATDSYRTPFTTMLASYRSNPGALRAMNAFNIRDNEEIYGDPAQLASRIALVGGRTRGTDNSERSYVDEVNRLLTNASSTDPAVRSGAEGALTTLLATSGISLAAVRTRLAVANRSQVTLEDLAGIVADNARAEGVIGPSVLASENDRSMLNVVDAPELVRFVARHSDASGGLLRWITENRDNISDMHAVLVFARQNSAGGFRNTQEAAAFMDRNVATFRSSGWFSARARTRAELEAERRRAIPTPTGRTQQRPQHVREFPGAMYTEMVPERPAQAQPPGQPAVVSMQLTPQQRQQSTAFFSSERGQALGTMLDGILDAVYSDRSAASTGEILRQVFGAPDESEGNIRAPESARTAVREEVFRILMSTNAADVRMRTTWEITVTGTGDDMRVTVDMRRARDPLRNRIRQFALERQRAMQQQGGSGTQGAPQQRGQQ